MIDQYGVLKADPATLTRGKMIRVRDVLAWMIDFPAGGLDLGRRPNDEELREKGIVEAALMLSRALPDLELGRFNSDIAASGAFSVSPTKGYRLNPLTDELFGVESITLAGSVELFKKREDATVPLARELRLPRADVIRCLLEEPMENKQRWIADFSSRESWTPGELLCFLCSEGDLEAVYAWWNAHSYFGIFDGGVGSDVSKHLGTLDKLLRVGRLVAIARTPPSDAYTDLPAIYWNGHTLTTTPRGKLVAKSKTICTPDVEVSGFTKSSIEAAFPSLFCPPTIIYPPAKRGRRPHQFLAALKTIKVLVQEELIDDLTKNTAVWASVNERLNADGQQPVSESTIRLARKAFRRSRSEANSKLRPAISHKLKVTGSNPVLEQE